MPKIGFSDKQLREIERMARYLTQDQIADVLEISARTLRRRLRDDPRVLSAYKKGKGETIAAVARSLIFQALAGNTTAAIFFLKTQAGWRETDLNEVRPSDISKLTDRELDRRRRQVGLAG